MKKFIFLSCFMTSQLWAASFDCNKASTPVERTICSDAELSLLDEHLADTYLALKNSYPEFIGRNLAQFQRSWVRERDRFCKAADTECLKTSYKIQIDVLKEDMALDSSDLKFDGNDVVVKVGADIEGFTDLKGRTFKTYFTYPNTKLSVLRQLMSHPFTLGFSPYNTFDHPLKYMRGATVRYVVSCADYIDARNEGFELSSSEPERFVAHYVEVCDKVNSLLKN
jgi:uncharacterized protein YecT (DUF1311 family)